MTNMPSSMSESHQMHSVPGGRVVPDGLEVLVVDDEPTLRALVAEVLAGLGHHVATAADAPAAMRFLTARAFDVVVTDIRLPGGDGLSVFRLARREHPSTEVILMTAYGDVDEAVASIKEGALDYLTKPFELDEITTRIARVNERRAREITAVPSPDGAGPVALLERMRRCERECLLEALGRTGGRKAAAAQLLGISRKSLWKKMRQHGLSAHAAADRDSAPSK